MPPLNIEPQRTLLASMYTSLKHFVSSRVFFHFLRSTSLDAYRIYRLRVPAWKKINGYMGYVGRKTRSEMLVLAVTSSLRCSGGPMNGPRRRKSKGIGWRAKLVKAVWWRKGKESVRGSLQSNFPSLLPSQGRYLSVVP